MAVLDEMTRSPNQRVVHCHQWIVLSANVRVSLHGAR
jgi:hypothetical protein